MSFGIISRAHTVTLEKTGGAKRFEVRSESRTRQLSGAIMLDNGKIDGGSFTWK